MEQIRVPGALDLIAGVKSVVRRHSDMKAVIAIAVLIKGDTDVYKYSCRAVSSGISMLNTQEGIPPVISGVQMFRSEGQARDRLGSDEGRKLGISWAKSALSMSNLYS